MVGFIVVIEAAIASIADRFFVKAHEWWDGVEVVVNKAEGVGFSEGEIGSYCEVKLFRKSEER